jgi:hypothetical protein
MTMSGDVPLSGRGPLDVGPSRASIAWVSEIVRRQVDGTWLYVVDDPFSRG